MAAGRAGGAADGGAGNGRAQRVLVIDDNPDDLELAARSLEREVPGLRVDRLTSSQNLAQILEEGGYDLVITDHALGWTDGFSVLRTVRAVDPDRPVILYTGTAGDEILAAGWEAGFDDCVLKAAAGSGRLVAAVRVCLKRLATERRATQLRTRMRGLLNRLRVGVFRATPDGLLIEANPAFRRLLGLRAPELRGELELPALFREPEDYRRLVRQLRRHRQVQEEVDLLRPDGTPLPAALIMALSVDDDGTDYIEGLLEDVGARKRAEAEIRESHAKLRKLARHLQSVREEERGRIAGQIHDELGQALTALKMELVSMGKRLPDGGGEEVGERIRYMSRLIDDTIGKVRRIATELRPRLLDEFGLVAAIEWQSKDLLGRSGIHCTLDLDENLPDLHPEMAVSLFRIAQELLTNVLRHAAASRVAIRLGRADGEVILGVADDGRGLDRSKVSVSRSFGLLEMEERARMWGGAVEIASRPGAGTSVEVRIPLA